MPDYQTSSPYGLMPSLPRINFYMLKIRAIQLVLLTLLTLGSITPAAAAERVKDLASISGVRENQLLGYGLIVGLDGTGDKTVQYTEQSLKSMLSQFGVTIPPGQTLNPKNVASVTVHATMAAFVKPGQRIDVTISSLGNASSLRGGTLLMTPLRGADGEVYAIAQGDIFVGGFSASGADGTAVQKNITSAGRIPNGATVERAVGSALFNNSGEITLNLHTPDFTTAERLVIAINDKIGMRQAVALDAVSVVVQGPTDPAVKVQFISLLENIELTPAKSIAKIIVNARTGTIVIGEHVTVMPAAVSHGNLTVTINENVQVNQPAPLANGETAITPNTNIEIEEQNGTLRTIPKGVTLNEVVKSLNAVGASTSDLIAILEALKQLGALRGQLVIM